MAFLTTNAVAAPAVSELGRPPIRSFDEEDYPSDSPQNWGGVQGPHGRMFVGSSGGLQVFDGVRWTLLPPPNHTVVFDMLLAGERIFFGTEADAGYFEADETSTWRFVSVVEGSGAPDFDVVYQVEQTPAGIFFGTEHYLLWWRPEGGPDQGLSWFKAPTSFGRIFVVRDELFVAEAERGLVRFFPGTGTFEAVAGAEAFIGERVSDYFESRGQRFVLSRNRGLFEHEGDRFTSFPTEVDEWLRTQGPRSPIALPNGGIAIASRRDGLVLLEGDGSLRRHITLDHGLPWPAVDSLTLDHQGGLWASQDGGISRIDIDSGITVFDRSLGASSLERIIRYQGHLILATRGGLRILRSGDNRQARFVALGPEGADSLAIWSLLDGGDQLLVGDSGGIVSLVLDPFGEIRRRRRVFEGRRVLDMVAAGSTGEIVYAGLQDGVARLHQVQGRWQSQGKLRGIDRPVVFLELEDAGTLWLGTTTGLYYRLRDLEAWPDVTIEKFGTEAGLPKGNLHLFRVGGRVVFATFSGFRRFVDGPRPHFEPDPAFAGSLADGSLGIHRMAEGVGERLWIYSGPDAGLATPNPKGVWAFDAEPLRLLPPGKVDAILAEADGVVWFGKNDGVVRFDSRLGKPPRPPLGVHIRRVSDLKTQEPIYAGAVISESLGLPPRQPDGRDLRFEVALPAFALPAGVRYRYRLEGLDDRWSEWTTENRKDYTNLPLGPLKLRVEARDAYGQEAPPAEVFFRVSPPWFRSPLAYLGGLLLFGLAIAGLVFLLVRRRTARIEQERVRLAEEVARRTEELQTRTEELQARTGDLQIRTEELQVADESRRRLFANVSHEFRTPLTLTLGPLEDASRGDYGELEPRLAGDLRVALRNSRQLLNLVDQILDINRLEAGVLEVRGKVADLGHFVEDVAGQFRVAAEKCRIDLDLSAIEAGLEVFFDAAHLERVIVNLLANAFKFTPVGGRIGILLERLDTTAVFEVEDSGPGISEKDLSHVFDRFFQSDGIPVRGASGTGIGLSLVKELVELHSGLVEAMSEAGRGARIRVYLPLGTEQPTSPRKAKLEQSRQTISEGQVTALIAGAESWPVPEALENPDLDQPTLLIVDDNAELRGFLRRVFAETYRVLEAGEGEAALELCRRHLPDLIVCDVMMPRMTGFEFLQALRKDPEIDFLPVILLTARSTAEDALEGFDCGADDYLKKPFESRELEARVRATLDSRRRLKARWCGTSDRPSEAGQELKKSSFELQLMEELEKRIGDPGLTVESLAADLAMDRSNLYRQVRSTLSITPKQLIRQTRLQGAAQMLAQDEGNVSEIAYSLGFKSVAHFSASFRKEFGAAPSAWRLQQSQPK